MFDVKLRGARTVLWLALLSTFLGLALLPPACFATDVSSAFSLNGTWQGTFSGQRITCAKWNSDGCCIQRDGLKVESGPVSATFSQNGTSVSAVIVTRYGSLALTGTNIDGSVSLETTVLAHCNTIEVPAGLVGTLSLDCSTTPSPKFTGSLDGSFYIDKYRTIAGTFSLHSESPINVQLFIGGPYSMFKPHQPTTMNAGFTPKINGSPIRLTNAATACGFDSFNFVQQVTADPHPWMDSAGKLLSIPYSDPPPGGYFGHPDNAYPFFWNQNELLQTAPCTTGEPYPPGDAKILTTNTLGFQDCPADSRRLETDPPVQFTTSLVGDVSGNPSSPLYTWSWQSTFNGSALGGITQLKSYGPVDPSSGSGGVKVTNINGVQLPPAVLPTDISITASGLAYSRVSQTFVGTVTLTNISSNTISGPLQFLFFWMPTNVALVNATGNLSGTPYLTVPGVASLEPGQSVTVNVQFSNPSNVTINATPVVYSGSI